MAKYSSKDVGFFTVGGYDVLGTTSKIEESAELKTEETTPLGVDAEEYTSTGVRKVGLTQDGWFDDATGSIHDLLATLPAASAVGMLAFQGNAVSKLFSGYPSIYRTTYNRQVNLGAVQKANGEYACSAAAEEGYIAAPMAARTTAGNTDSTYADMGASGSNGGYGYLAVRSITLTGATGFVAKLRHSSDHITFADLVTFTSTTAITSERKSFAGTINRYLSCSWAWTGGTSPSATFAVGAVKNA